MRYIANAISLGMLDDLSTCGVTRWLECRQVGSITDACLMLHNWSIDGGFTSCVGHADTAQLLTTMLDQPIEVRRVTTSLLAGDEILVAQYNGPRLPEGAISLPPGAKIRWIYVRVHKTGPPTAPAPRV